MTAVALYPTDLDPFASIDPVKASAMIDDALALAARVAPCILTDDFAYAAAAKAILRGAILRWNEAGTGATVQQSAGPFAQSIDTKQQRRGMFWPQEIEQLQDLCKGPELNGAFSVDTAPTTLTYGYLTGFGYDYQPGWYPFGDDVSGYGYSSDCEGI